MKSILNNKKLKTILRASLVAVGTAFLVGFTTLGSHKTLEVSAAGQSGMKISLYKWYKIGNLDELHSIGGKDVYNAFIMWKDGSNVYYVAGGNVGDNNLRGTNITVDPYIEYAENYQHAGFSHADGSYTINNPYFLTKSLDNTPKIHLVGSRGNYDYKFKLQFSTGKYLWTSYWDHLEAHDDGDTWVAVNLDGLVERGKRTYNSADGAKRPFWFFYDRSAAYDTDIKNDGDKFYGVSSGGGYKNSDFYLYGGMEVKYDAIGDYTIAGDQVLTINNDTFLLDGKKLKIEKDGMLVVRGNLYCNGAIDCEGTIVVEKGAKLMPFSPSNAGGDVYVHNGGSLIVMSGGKAMLGLPQGLLNAKGSGVLKTADATIYNYGLLVSGYTEFLDNTTVENHEGAAMYLAYSIEKNAAKFNSGDSSKYSGDLGLTSRGSFTNGNNNVIFKAYKGCKYGVGRNVSKYNLTFVSVDETGNETSWKTNL
jgi:hypothetical protein